MPKKDANVPQHPRRRGKQGKAPFRVEFDGIIVKSIAQIVSSIAEICEEFKNMVIRRLRRH